MWRPACARLSRALRGPVAGRRGRASGEGAEAAGPEPPAPLLDFLVCPLSKKPLRYDAATRELVNEELGIAYPIVDGIPNMIPQAARSTLRGRRGDEAAERRDEVERRDAERR